jgi:transglutaminase-like putative cysteine protease
MTVISDFTAASEFVDWQHPDIVGQATKLAASLDSRDAIAQACFEFVRDEIRHSADANDTIITIKASDVLKEASGYCYAKSHLLAALLRANQIPAALCYQRLSLESGGAPFCLHGLNAVQLENGDWYRVDPRGNKPGVNAQFIPPIERLAFPLECEGEEDIDGLFAEPMPEVIKAMRAQDTVQNLYRALPDIA